MLFMSLTNLKMTMQKSLVYVLNAEITKCFIGSQPFQENTQGSEEKEQ